jgi:hypothetical protein
VACAVAGTAEGATHGMIDKDGARRWNYGHDVENRADDEGGNSTGLDPMSDETDGLVAKGSIGYQQGKIDTGLL